MRNILACSVAAVAAMAFGSAASAADLPQGQYQPVPPQYQGQPPADYGYGQPPVEQGYPPPQYGYGYPPPPPVTYYQEAVPPVVVVPRPYYPRPYYGPVYGGGYPYRWGYGPHVARGYEHWGHGYRRW
jgi:hypothetical protein